MVIKWSPECPVVTGYNRACIYDLPRKEYSFIPKEYSKSISQLNGMPIQKIKGIDKNWLKWFYEKEYCYNVPVKFSSNFVDIDYTWSTPSVITNAIIEINKSLEDFPFRILEEAICKHILIRFIDFSSSKDTIAYLNKNILNITFHSVDIHLVNNKSELNETEVIKIFKDGVQAINDIEFVKITSKSSKYFKPKFIIDIRTYLESQKYNLFFNKKLFFSSKGEINNYPKTKNIGYVKNINSIVDLKKMISKNKSYLLWNISKDKIDVCKDCEFRNMCIDSRIPLKRKDGSYYYQNECSYNPYISKWSKDNGFLSLKDCGITNDLKGFFFNKKTLYEINKDLWQN